MIRKCIYLLIYNIHRVLK